MFLFIASTASAALVCEPGDTLCTAVNQMQIDANAAYAGADPVSDSMAQKLYNRLAPVTQRLVNNGCNATTDVSSFASGAYDNTAGTLTGTGTDGAVSGTIAGRTISGSIGGMTFGDNFGAYNGNRQILADRSDDGYFAGTWQRVSGNRGVFMALTASCDADHKDKTTLDPWFRGDSSAYPDDPAEGPFEFGFVGEFRVHDGDSWGTNPPTYTCLEACASVFGGDPANYQCSTDAEVVDNMAWTSTWGGPCAVEAEDYKLSELYNCGSVGCSTSALVADHCGGGQTNYCFGIVDL